MKLANLPTPVQFLPRASAELGVEVFVKRDDLTGFGLSGNKVRKLERLLADAAEVTTIITTGGLQSNHCRATALAARRCGKRPVLLLRGEAVDVPDGNLLLDQLAGAELFFCTPEQYRHERDAIMAMISEQLHRCGETTCIIPEGGSNAIGSLAFVDAAAELEEDYDHTFVAVGSGGTLAGLAMSDLKGRLHGIAVCDDEAFFTARVEAIAAEADRPLKADWHVDDRYKGPAYGEATDAIWADIRHLARTEGLLVDPCYTGKAWHALCEEARAGRLSGRVLFWHTGGAFALFGRGAEAIDP